jgi:hypothetical protein
VLVPVLVPVLAPVLILLAPVLIPVLLAVLLVLLQLLRRMVSLQWDGSRADAFLAQHGLELDLAAGQARSCREALGLAAALLGEIDAGGEAPVGFQRTYRAASGPAAVFTRRVGPVHTVMSCTRVRADLGAFLALTCDDRMGDLARLWDETFISHDVVAVEAASEGPGAPPMRVVRWRFRAAPLASRELAYLILPVAHAGGARVTVFYLSVKGAKVPPSAGGFCRARLLWPTFDDASVKAEPELLHLIHSMTCELGGWVSAWAQRLVVDGAIAAQSSHEVHELERIFLNPAFRQIVQAPPRAPS